LIKGKGFARDDYAELRFNHRRCVGLDELNFTRETIGIAVCFRRTIGAVIVFTAPIIKASRKEITALQKV